MPNYSMSGRLWTRETVLASIRAEARAGHDLSYSCTEKRVSSLVRAAERSFGNWGAAVNAAGFDYDAIRRYRKWTREKVIERILALYDKGEDLSWRNISIRLDPPLAAAALHAGRFASWSEALHAAGLDPTQISRYRRWTLPLLREELLALETKGVPLDRMHLSADASALLAAVYRIGGGLLNERKQLQRSRRQEHHATTRSYGNYERTEDGAMGSLLTCSS